MDNLNGSTWPEQDAVNSWTLKHNVSLTATAIMELKEVVTNPRIQVQQQRDYYKRVAEKLWEVLDAIDTADDMAKSNDKAYRKITSNIHQRRFLYAESKDGYTLEFKNVPTAGD